MTEQTIRENMLAFLRTKADSRAIKFYDVTDHRGVGTEQEAEAVLDQLLREDVLEGRVRDGEMYIRGLATTPFVHVLFNGEALSLEARQTASGNLSFKFQGYQHIMKPDGTILKLVRTQWERSTVLVRNESAQ